MLEALVDLFSNSIPYKNNNKNKKVIRIKSVSANGSYDTNNNFRYLEVERIIPGIKVRNNSIISAKNNRLRNIEVLLQSKDLLKWKRKESTVTDGWLKQSFPH